MSGSLMGLLLGGLVGGSPQATDWMAGKVKTDRSVVLEVVVAAPPEVVFRDWTTREGLATFFAPDARLELTPGGRYEMIFVPDKDPEGASYGTKGAHLLKIVPGRELVFEWITFTEREIPGLPGPPASAAERAVRPLPTWLELQFEPTGDRATRVRLAHHGFRRGGVWNPAYAYFQSAWKGVLEGLVARHASAAADDAPQMVTYYFVLLTRGARFGGEDSPELQRLQEAHMANIRRLGSEGRLALAGPFGDDGAWRGIFILKAASIEEAKALVETDSAVQAKRLAVEIHPLLLMKGVLP